MSNTIVCLQKHQTTRSSSSIQYGSTHHDLFSVIGKAARILAPCAGGRRHTRSGFRAAVTVSKRSKSQLRGRRVPYAVKGSSPSSTLPTKWKPPGGQVFLPRFTSIKSDPESDEDEPIQDKADRIMTRSRYLPGTRYYASNHVMMNRERTKRTIAPLVRMPELDEIVRFHVKAMSKENLA
jgi:hypothetical protein